MTANPSDDGTAGRARQAADRKARLEQELRANLTKRKSRMRAEKAKSREGLDADDGPQAAKKGENDASA